MKISKFKILISVPVFLIIACILCLIIFKTILFFDDKVVFITINPQFYKTIEGSVKICGIGDIMMHSPVKESAAQHNIIDESTNESSNNEGYDFLFEGVKEAFQSVDITVGNMEFPICPPYKSEPFKFNCKPIVLEAIKKSKISLLTLANNHSYDQGVVGLKNTVAELVKSNIPFIGAGIDFTSSHESYIFEKTNLKIGFIGCSGVFNNRLNTNNKSNPYVNDFYKKEEIINDINMLKDKVDLVVMVIHTGVEYNTIPQKRDQELMKEYLEAGAVVIIGHHPHVLQNVEKFITTDGRECHILYSLGNFISNQSRNYIYKVKSSQSPLPRESVAVNITVLKTFHPIENKAFTRITNVDFIPLWNVNYSERNDNKKIVSVIRPELLNNLIEKQNEISKDQTNDEKLNEYFYLKEQIFTTLNILN